LKDNLDEIEFKSNKSDLNDQIFDDLRRTISQQNNDIHLLDEALHMKHSQFEIFRHQMEMACVGKIEEAIQLERLKWDNDIKFEYESLNEEKEREITKIKADYQIYKERSLKMNIEIEQLKNELAHQIEERNNAMNRARDIFLTEMDKFKNEAFNVTFLYYFFIR
jgi:hypothetical protein